MLLPCLSSLLEESTPLIHGARPAGVSHLLPPRPHLRTRRAQQLFPVLWVLLLITEPVLGRPGEVFMGRVTRTGETTRTSGLEEGSCRSVKSRCRPGVSWVGACPAGEGEAVGDTRGRLGPDSLEPRGPHHKGT